LYYSYFSLPKLEVLGSIASTKPIVCKASLLCHIDINAISSFYPSPKLEALGTMASTQDLATYRYELSNHLGNTLTTFTGRKLGQGTIGSEVSHYEPEIVSLGDYDPFGVELYGRSYNNVAYSGTSGYRYGFNGKELDKSGEWGSLTQYDYGFRIYNPSIGKFLSMDPITDEYPELTPYQFASNRPIDGIDLDGLEYLSVNHPAFADKTRPSSGFFDFLSGCNQKSTYGEILRKQYNSYRTISIAGNKYYDIGKHLYYDGKNLNSKGTRGQQATEATQIGLTLINFLNNLPDAPIGYWAPNCDTKKASEITLSQNQALQYDNCEGVCYATTESRANNAYVILTGSGVVDLTVSNKNIDHRIASSQSGNDPYLGFGAGGPFARAGLGTTVNNDGVWAGQLQTGALLQVWNSTDQNNLMGGGGHSVIFRNYTFDNNGSINGIEYSDYHGDSNVWSQNDLSNKTILGVNLKDRN
jgi:RHS repeat-associated protein